MSALSLRRVDHRFAQATRQLGQGLTLGFSAQSLMGELTLRPVTPGTFASNDGVWLRSAVGLLRLSDASAVLSLLGNAPAVLQGTHQPWYWQFLNQQLSAPIAALLAPIEPVEEDTCEFAAVVHCRLQVRLGDESVHARLATDPDTLLRLLSAAPWQAHQPPLPDDWQVPHPLVIGQFALTLEQLASLRPGDVVLPEHCHFDSEGNGRLDLAGRHWVVGIEAHAQRLFLRLSHEEDFQDGR
ncbi:type III secretion system protein [Pseudomonas sp. RTC3]|uniref:type III secretion system protein n=1 Tax=unclassified Pseudomonas TaxID=196821 RepID=UPI002AB53664|nr:type III secretion system protein [Pseudomonas sp. 5C2]MDY7564692.1 type III secretion system protein [Pseudomonas sp. 5C2]MEB0060661.1 type III secretion system protein [Pseudomonas sp. RTC3]MEB0240880.1 type III secretion system protein [Pseudomonas sp. 5C2]